MADIHLEQYGKDSTIHAQSVGDEANGFDTQPEYGDGYDPGNDKRGKDSIGAVSIAVSEPLTCFPRHVAPRTKAGAQATLQVLYVTSDGSHRSSIYADSSS